MKSTSNFTILRGNTGSVVAINDTRVTPNKVYGELTIENNFVIDDDSVIEAVTEKLTVKEKLQKIQQWLLSNADNLKKDELTDDLNNIVTIINEIM
jgi:peroxiredoxin